MRLTIFFALTAIIAAAGCSEAPETTLDAGVDTLDTVYHGGQILTMTGDTPVYVEAIGVQGGRIAFAGPLAEATERMNDSTRQVDLAGKTLLPGFIDPHSHYMNSLLVADQAMLFAPPAGPGADVESIIATLETFAAARDIPEGEMIIGYGYDDTVMPGGRLLNRDDLDAAFPDNPVRVDHVSMHGTVLNSKALDFYGISADTETPPGGVIVRKPGTDEPYGLIMETAFIPVLAKTAPMSAEQEISATRAGQMIYAAAGITTAHEGATHLAQLQTLSRASDAGANIIDIIAFPFITELDAILAEFPVETWGEYRNRLKIGGVKITGDGSPQGRTAYFTTPYLTGGPSGEKDWTGEPTFPAQVLEDAMQRVYAMGVPLNYHANGDAAIQMLLDAHAKIAADNPSKERNVTVIHAQFTREDQIARLAEYRFKPSFYTLHTFYFADAHRTNRGPTESQYISPMRDAIDAGIRPTNHTDYVVAPIDQLFVIWSAVNRISRGGENVGLDQRITPFEALKAITLWAAEQYQEESQKGTLEVGKLADMVILDQNPVTVEPMHIRDIRVMETIKEGETIFSR